MLVLTRRVGEAVIIGDNIHITLVAIGGERVQLGIVAPAEVIVDRQEVHEKRIKSLDDDTNPEIHRAVG